MSKDERMRTDFRSPVRLKANICQFVGANYFGQAHVEVYAKASALLNEHNLEIANFPMQHHFFPMVVTPSGIPTRTGAASSYCSADHEAVRDYIFKIMNSLKIANSHLPVLYCSFEGIVNGEVWGVVEKWKERIVVVSPTPGTDKVTLLHEIGHVVPTLDHEHKPDSKGNRNFLDEAEPRSTMYKYQVEAFSKAFFVSS